MVSFPEPSSVQKEPWIAVNLSRAFPGLGQIYAHQVKKGILIFSISLASTFIQIASFFSPAVGLLWGGGLFIFNFGLWIWNLFDAHKSTINQNKKIAKENHRLDKNPWIAIFLSSFIPGIGHFYLKKPLLGIVLVSLSAILFWIPIVGLIWTCFVIHLTYTATLETGTKVPKKVYQFIAIGFISPFIISILSAFLIRTFVAEARYIPAGSMEPTLQINDRLTISKIDYHFHAPRRGDIVIFNPTQTLKAQGFHDAFIKRVIGIPGDRVEIKNGSVFINNQNLSEPYVDNGAPTLTEACVGGPIGDDQVFLSKPALIPKDNYLVLGDNRTNSYDGRCWGLVSRQDIIGKATKFFWPLNRMGPVPEVKYPDLPS
jgi:signal peptidase I